MSDTGEESPKPDDREAFIEWMVGRNFKLRRDRKSPIYFHAADYFEEVDGVPEGVPSEEIEDLRTKTVYLRATVLDSKKIEIDGEYITAKLDKILPPQDSSEVHKLPFDNVRIGWMQGRLTEL